MKKLFPSFTILVIVFAISSCSKNNQSNSSGGSWTFQGTTYYAHGPCLYDSSTATLNAVSSTHGFGDQLSFSFNGYPAPQIITSGIYNCNYLSTNNGCYIEVTLNYTTYYSSGASGSATVNVNGNKISASSIGNGIWLKNLNNLSDSSLVTFNISQ